MNANRNLASMENVLMELTDTTVSANLDTPEKTAKQVSNTFSDLLISHDFAPIKPSIGITFTFY